MGEPSILRQIVMCPLGLCWTFATRDDETGCWGECTLCGKRVGFVSRAELRAYIDRANPPKGAGEGGGA